MLIDENNNRCIGTATIGSKGQIVIPKTIRDMFDLKENEVVVIMADIKKGIAIVKQNELMKDEFFPGNIS